MIVRKLTAETIAKAPPAGKSSYYILERGGPDTVPGFGVRVGAREKVYVLRFRRRPYKVGDSILPVKAARTQARILLLRLLGNEDVVTDTRSLQVLRDAFLERHARPNTAAAWAKDQERMWDQRVLPFRLEDGRDLAAVPVRSVTADHLAQLHASLKATPFLANRVLSMLHTAFNLAALWKWRQSGDPNPAQGIQRYPERSRRDRHYSPAEYQAWGQAITDAYAAAEEAAARKPVRGSGTLKRRGVLSPFAIGCCELLVYTGARPREARELRWEWLEASWHCDEPADGPAFVFGPRQWSGRFRLPVAKGDRAGDAETGRDLWLNAPAFAVLERMARLQGWADENSFPPSGPVFPGRGQHRRDPIAGMKTAWQRLCERAGIAGATPKTLRHSFVTEGTPAGVARELMQDLAGHASPAITDGVYRARVDDAQRAAAEKMGEHLRRRMYPTASKEVM